MDACNEDGGDVWVCVVPRFLTGKEKRRLKKKRKERKTRSVEDYLFEGSKIQEIQRKLDRRGLKFSQIAFDESNKVVCGTKEI